MRPPGSLASSRRQFLKSGLLPGSSLLFFPAILDAAILGKDSPGNKIQIAQIGCGRAARELDLTGILKQDMARIVAVCDPDSRRLADAKRLVENFYARKQGSRKAVGVKAYGDYRELLHDRSIDAVMISTPDHWHAEPVIAAALAGKDVCLQDPFCLTLAEGRAMANTLKAGARVFQLVTRHRRDSQLRLACELVRNGRLGTLRAIQIGFPVDRPCGEEPEMPVPSNLNYETWLGCAPLAPYTEKRVHPQKDYSRPGWTRLESYCLGAIGTQGSRYLDVAHWAMGVELTGPIAIEGKAKFPAKGLCNVHGPFRVEATYANGATLTMADSLPRGIRFEGAQGWLSFSPTQSLDADASSAGNGLRASNSSILRSRIASGEIHMRNSDDYFLNWLTSIQSRKPATIAPEQAFRSASAAILGWIALKTARKLSWDPAGEIFPSDDRANALRSREQRSPYGSENLLNRRPG